MKYSNLNDRSVGRPTRTLAMRSRIKPNIAAKRIEITHPDLNRFVVVIRVISRHVWKIRFQVPNDISANMRLRTYGSDIIVDIPRSARTMRVTANEVSSMPVEKAISPGW